MVYINDQCLKCPIQNTTIFTHFLNNNSHIFVVYTIISGFTAFIKLHTQYKHLRTTSIEHMKSPDTLLLPF